MFTNISWTDYFMAVAILLAIYYLVVGMLYFSTELKDLFSGKRKLSFRAALSNVPRGNATLSAEKNHYRDISVFEETIDDEFDQVEQLIKRLKEVIKDASTRKLIPEEFKQYVQLIFKEYPSLKSSSLRTSINELVVSECQKYGTVTLTEEEVDLLWKNNA